MTLQKEEINTFGRQKKKKNMIPSKSVNQYSKPSPFTKVSSLWSDCIPEVLPIYVNRHPRLPIPETYYSWQCWSPWINLGVDINLNGPLICWYLFTNYWNQGILYNFQGSLICFSSAQVLNYDLKQLYEKYILPWTPTSNAGHFQPYIYLHF